MNLLLIDQAQSKRPVGKRKVADRPVGKRKVADRPVGKRKVADRPVRKCRVAAPPVRKCRVADRLVRSTVVVANRRLSESVECPIIAPPLHNRENPNIHSGNESLPVDERLFRVVIIDNDYNTYQEVIDVCMTALGVDFDHAYRIALAVDNNGEAEVVQAPRTEADRIATVIRSIGIEVRVFPL